MESYYKNIFKIRSVASKKNWKNSYGFWKINKFIWNKKRYLIIYLKKFKNSLITFRHYHCSK